MVLRFPAKESTVNSETCYKFLKENLKPAIKRAKCRELSSEIYLQCHSDAPA
jgi:hypothetical protein